MTLAETLKSNKKVLRILYDIWKKLNTTKTFKEFAMFHFPNDTKMPIVIKQWLIENT